MNRTSRRSRRRGVALVIVLLIVALALAVSYASMRAQTITLQTQRNAGLRGEAHSAALTGMALALREMQTASWTGVSSTLSRSLGDGRRFEATYTTGDATLKEADAAYAEYPFRVTVAVTGYARPSGTSDRELTHALRAVVRLIPRALATQPTGWSDITNNTVCQWAAGSFSVNPPCRIEGPVRVRAPLDLAANSLTWSTEGRDWYFSGLNSLRSSGNDCRLFSGPVKLTYSSQSLTTLSLLSTSLGATTQDMPMATSLSWPSGSLPSGYRLYPGGCLYFAPTLGCELRNVTLKNDPKTNPIGAYYRLGGVRVYENVKVQGVVFLAGSTDADLEFYGANAQFDPVELPALQGSDVASTAPVRLPTIFAADEVRFIPGSQTQINGLVVALNRFSVDENSYANLALSIRGKVAAQNVQIARRSEWIHDSAWWSSACSNYISQYLQPWGEANFPLFLQGWGLAAEPRLKILSDSSARLYHWQNPNNPIYVPHSNDATPLAPSSPGLRWELVTWSDTPPS